MHGPIKMELFLTTVLPQTYRALNEPPNVYKMTNIIIRIKNSNTGHFQFMFSRLWQIVYPL